MGVSTRAGRSFATWVAFACVALLLISVAMWWVSRSTDETKLSAYFTRTVGLYEGSSVAVLGVPVGEITNVQPVGGKVRVDMVVDSDVEIPADAGAVVIAPSLVSDRFVQLTPAYNGGPTMSAGTVIPNKRTATPVGIDRLYESLNKVAKSLGPHGANKNGALSDVLNSAAKALDGNGKNLNTTVHKLAQLSKTLNHSKGDLFETISNLQKFTHMLARSDRQLDEFYSRLATVSSFLADDSDKVGSALSSLASALQDVREFVETNSDILSTNVDKLASITGVLVKHRAQLAEVLDVMPVAVTNFLHTYDAQSGTTMVRYNANELTFPLGQMLCRFGSALTPEQLPDVVGKTCSALAPLTKNLPDLPSISDLLHDFQTGGSLLPLPGMGSGQQQTSGGSQAGGK